MKAAILVEQNQPLVIDDVEIPEGLDYGQVLVRVAYSGICGSQIGEIDGVKGPDRFLPHLLGHEGSGVVINTGPGVTTVKPDDHVVLHWKPGAGIESPTPRYRWQGKTLNAGWVTTFNEYAVVAENRVTTIPATFDMRHAALLGCALTTGFGVINNDAQVKIGESVVVFGAGGVGLAIIQGAALASANPIVAIDLYDEKLAVAKTFGATHTINSNQSDAVESIKDILGEGGADVVIDNTGDVGVIEKAYDLTKPQGRTILVGVPKAGHKPSISSLPLHFGKVLTGSHGGSAQPHHDIPRYIALANTGKIQLKPMITDTFSLDNINDAIEMMRHGKIAGRCMIDVTATQA